MRGKKNPVFNLLSGVVMILALFVGACDSDDVTGPVEARNPPPVSDSTNNSTWTISVTANPNEFDLNAGSGTAQILVSARRSDNNQIVAPGTTALLSTTNGTLTTNDGQTGNSVPIVFDEAGQSRATLVTGGFSIDTTIIVRAQIESSFGSTRIQMIDVQAAPFQMTSVSPNVGPPSGGTTLTISGSGFVSPARVLLTGSFGTLVAENTNVQSSTRITARTPAINLASGQNAAATVTVENAFDENGNPTATDSLGGAFTYTRSTSGATTLKLISISPTQGPNEGGTQVTIRGEGFGNEAQVYFTNGPLIEATVLSITPTRLEVITPSATGPNAPNANSRVNLTVRDPTSGQQATLTGAFQYGGAGGQMFISSIRPTEGEYLGGDEVTLFGQGFEEPVAVEAGGLAQQVLSVSGTEILFRTVGASIGCSNQSGTSRVVNIETNESTTGPAFTYRPVRPQILGLSRNTGVAGDEVTIFGVGRGYTVGFDPPIRVTFDGVPASGSTIGGDFGDEVTVTAPPYSGGFNTAECAAGAAFVNVQVTNLNTGCSDTFNNAFGYIPDADEDCTGGGDGGGGNGVLVGVSLSLPTAQAGSLGPYTFTVAPLGGDPAIVEDSIFWWFDNDGPGVGSPQDMDTFMGTHTFTSFDTHTIYVRCTNADGEECGGDALFTISP